MRCFVGSNLGTNLRELLAAQGWHDTDIGIGSAEFVRLRKPQNIGLSLDRCNIEAFDILRPALGLYCNTAELTDRVREYVAMAFVVPLEKDGKVEHRLLQQAAFGTDLIRLDCFMLESQGNVEDIDVTLARRPCAFAKIASERRCIAQDADCGSRQHARSRHPDNVSP